jgi:hypothetical protein
MTLDGNIRLHVTLAGQPWLCRRSKNPQTPTLEPETHQHMAPIGSDASILEDGIFL